MKQAFILLGAPRSGTSVVSHMLSKFGVDFGNPEHFLDPKKYKHNPVFWELEWVNHYNDKVIDILGKRWKIENLRWGYEYLLPIDDDFLNLNKIEEELYELILSEWDNNKKIIGIKDPRFCFTFPIWRKVLSSMGYELKIVFIFRHPLGYLQSVKLLHNLSEHQHLNHWIQHNFASRYFVRDCSTYIVNYDNVMSDSTAEAERMAQNLNLNLDLVSDSSSIVNPNYYHHRLFADTGYTIVDNCYESLKNNTLSANEYLKYRDTYLLFREEIQNYKKLSDDVSQDLKYAKSELEKSRSQIEDKQAQLEKSQSQIEDKQVELKNYQSQIEEKQVQLELCQSELQQSHEQLQQSKLELQHIQTKLRREQITIQAMESSKFWKLRSRWFEVRDSLGLTEKDKTFQENLLIRIKYFWNIYKTKGLRYVANKILQKSTAKFNDVLVPNDALPNIPQSTNSNYQKWLNKNYPTPEILKEKAQKAENFSYKPLISLIMPVFNTPEGFLREAIESVLNQVYSEWELCIADDASSDDRVQKVLEDYSAKDSRIKIVFRTENGHISRCSNSALEIATGEFVALLDHDDLLMPDAIYEVASLLNEHPEADMIYSDEDKIDDSGKLRDPFFKPDWCPDSFLSRMYTCHLGVYRREIINLIGGFREGYEGSQDYDLVLRFTEKTSNIFHIPKILYHWRIHPQSAASQADVKPYAAIAAEKALADAMQRRGEEAQFVPVASCLGHYIVRYKISQYKLVSIIIPTKDLADTLDKCLTSIFEKTAYPNYEVILIDNGSQEQKTAEVFAKWQQKELERFKCYQFDIPFNYSKINNYGVDKAKGDYLLFLNNDTEVLTSDWIDAMVEQAQRKSIGAVGARLLYPDNTIQHAGVVIGIGGVAGHSHKNFTVDSPGYFDQLLTVNNYSAVTAACLMCRREVFETVGGFEEKLKVAFNDVDFCLKIAKKGYRNIYLPQVMLYHYESKSRGYEDTPEKLMRFNQEVEYMQNKWNEFIENDPCYNPNLSRKLENFSIEI